MTRGEPQRRGWTVRARLMLGICLVVALGLAAAGSVAFLIQRGDALTALDAHLENRVGAARAIVLGPSDPDEPTPTPFTSTSDAARAVIAGIVPDAGESTFALVDGRLAYVPGVATSVRLDRMPGFVETTARQTAGGHTVLGSIATAEGVYRYIAAPIRIAGDPTTAVFVMGASVDQALSGVFSQARTFALVGLVTMLIVIALGWFVSGRLLLPIALLTRTAERITSHNHAERMPARGNDDLSRLGRVVNRMLDRLDSELERRRRLLDDVRHELNTPITIVRGHLEILDVGDAEQVRAARDLSLDELTRMGELISDLTRLAESEDAPLDVAEVEVAELTRAALLRAGTLGPQRFVIGATATGTARMDRSKISEAWLQLVENAGKYAPADSVVTIGSAVAGRELLLWVQDEGPGVPEEARERIFERFGRVASHRGARGSGLGLSIVRAIARSHGGDVAHAPAGDGSRFTITIPLDDASPGGEEGGGA